MLKVLAKKYLPATVQGSIRQRSIRIRQIRAAPGSWTASELRYRSPYHRHRTVFDLIENIADSTEQRGALPLWEGYSKVLNYPTRTGPDATRTSNQVRTGQTNGEFFTWLVLQRKPSVVVEFGTAFGLSGMYWLAGLELNGKGHLFTFEPNTSWAEIAHENLSHIGNRFTLTNGTFEDNFALIKEQSAAIDLAYIDAIHTSKFVHAQLNLLLQKAAQGALIVFDDVDFSKDMRSCWDEISKDARYAAAFELNGIGFIELK